MFNEQELEQIKDVFTEAIQEKNKISSKEILFTFIGFVCAFIFNFIFTLVFIYIAMRMVN